MQAENNKHRITIMYERNYTSNEAILKMREERCEARNTELVEKISKEKKKNKKKKKQNKKKQKNKQ